MFPLKNYRSSLAAGNGIKLQNLPHQIRSSTPIRRTPPHAVAGFSLRQQADIFPPQSDRLEETRSAEMDGVLCDELLQEIIDRLPPSNAAAVSLVSKRWLAALRSYTTVLSLRIPFSNLSPPSPSLPTILSHFSNLSSLTILSNPFDDEAAYLPPPPTPPISSDSLLLAVACSPCAGRLTHLRFAVSSPVTAAVLRSSFDSLKNLTALHLSFLSPISLCWLASLLSLKSLSLLFHHRTLAPVEDREIGESFDIDDCNRSPVMLPVEDLLLSGVRACDREIGFLWRHCGRLRRLRLRACEGFGGGHCSPSFALCLSGLRELELRACRAIANRVLLYAADHCRALTSLLLHDGGGSEALHQFIARRASTLRTLDLRLPLDLHNDHLSAIAAATEQSNSPCLSALRLQSCCLVTGDGLRALVRAAAREAIEELSLVNCDVVEREPGLLSFLGQNLRRLRRLDLSFNETLGDKELGAMLFSCTSLVEIRLQGCDQLTDTSVTLLLRFCGLRLEVVNVSRCPGISVGGVESIFFNSDRLSSLTVEKEKVSEAAMALASRRGIRVG